MSSEQKAEEARQQKAENEIVAALAAYGRVESEHRGGTVLVTVGLVLKKVKRAILLAKLAQAERSLALHDSDEVYPGMTTGEALTAERDRLRREVEEVERD